MATKRAMSKLDLEALVATEISNALGEGTASSRLANERSKALDYYLARPFGNEQEGRSSVVSTDVRDTVEWIMPTIIRMFTAGEETVEYKPTSPQDEQFAKDATEYANVVWMEDNPGFLTYYTWFKDGLISKNGIVKIWWDDTPKEKRERYNGLPEDAYTALVNLDDVTVSEHTENKAEDYPTTHDVVITREVPGGRICVEPVPPEEFLISSDGRRINGWGRPGEARMVGHRTRTTLSDLKQEFDLTTAQIKALGGGDDDDSPSTTQEEISRDTVEDMTGHNHGGTNNPAMAVIWKTECYVRADMDGDGIAEMVKTISAGPGNTLIDHEAWDGPRPFASVTPVIMPHRFWGLSAADLIMDLQLIRSTILRQYLDNLYLSNNQRVEVVEKNIVDPTEVLTSRPGGAIRVKEKGSVNPILTPPIGREALQGLEYIDRLRENRTGVSERTQGISANALHDTMGGEQMLMNAAMGKIELIARAYAETGVKDAHKIVLWNICRYQKTPRTIQRQKNWVTIDPRGWSEDMAVSISVGLGTGDNQQRLQNAMLLGQAQAAAMAQGMVTPDNLMNTATELTKAMGYKNPERFFSKPQPGQQPPPSPEMAKVQAQAEADKAKLQADGAIKTQQMQTEAQISGQKMQQEGAIQSAQMQQEFALKRWQIEQEMLLKREQLAAELALKREEFQAELAMKERLGIMSAANERDAITSGVRMGGEPG